MTLHELLDFPEEIAKLSDKKLEEICAPFFNVTRPQMVMQFPEKKKPAKKIMSQEDFLMAEKLKKAHALAAAMGIKLQ